MSKVRVLVVDDSAFFRGRVVEALERSGAFEVVGSVANGRVALDRLNDFRPDIITLDFEMPELDGIGTLKRLRLSHPKLPVVMLSSHTEKGAWATLDALFAGATDYMAKPTDGSGLEGLEKKLVPLLLGCVGASQPQAAPDPRAPAPALPSPSPSPSPSAHTHAPPPPSPSPSSRASQARGPEPKVICIGASTGGPNALAELFGALRAPLPLPVLIVQHMPHTFTKVLAERLTGVGPTPVREAADGTPIRPGEALVAPGGRHMVIRRVGMEHVVALNSDPPENDCRPAADVLFRSAAENFGRQVLALVLTGMGQDGLLGATRLRELGSVVWAQDQASSVVWGMPGAVTRAHQADRVLPIGQVAFELTRHLERFASGRG